MEQNIFMPSVKMAVALMNKVSKGQKRNLTLGIGFHVLPHSISLGGCHLVNKNQTLASLSLLFTLSAPIPHYHD